MQGRSDLLKLQAECLVAENDALLRKALAIGFNLNYSINTIALFDEVGHKVPFIFPSQERIYL